MRLRGDIVPDALGVESVGSLTADMFGEVFGLEAVAVPLSQLSPATERLAG